MVLVVKQPKKFGNLGRYVAGWCPILLGFITVLPTSSFVDSPSILKTIYCSVDFHVVECDQNSKVSVAGGEKFSPLSFAALCSPAGSPRLDHCVRTFSSSEVSSIETRSDSWFSHIPNISRHLFGLFAFTSSFYSFFLMKLFSMTIFLLTLIVAVKLTKKDDFFRLQISLFLGMTPVALWLATSLHDSAFSTYLIIPMCFIAKNIKEIRKIKTSSKWLMYGQILLNSVLITSSRAEGPLLMILICFFALKGNLQTKTRNFRILIVVVSLICAVLLLRFLLWAKFYFSNIDPEFVGFRFFFENLKFVYGQNWELIFSVFGSDVNGEGASFVGNYGPSFPVVLACIQCSIFSIFAVKSLIDSSLRQKILIVIGFFLMFLPAATYKSLANLVWNIQLHHFLGFFLIFVVFISLRITFKTLNRSFLYFLVVSSYISTIFFLIFLYKYYFTGGLGVLPFVNGDDYSSNYHFLFILVLVTMGFHQHLNSIMINFDELVVSDRKIGPVVATKPRKKVVKKRRTKDRNWWSREPLNS